MQREITTAEARQLLTAALAAARIQAPHQVAALTQSMPPLALQIISGLISQAYNNGWKDGEEAETINHTFDADTETRTTDRLHHL